jgi:hypothetical protein
VAQAQGVTKTIEAVLIAMNRLPDSEWDGLPIPMTNWFNDTVRKIKGTDQVYTGLPKRKPHPVKEPDFTWEQLI